MGRLLWQILFLCCLLTIGSCRVLDAISDLVEKGSKALEADTNPPGKELALGDDNGNDLPDGSDSFFEGDIIVTNRLVATIEKLNLTTQGVSGFDALLRGKWPRAEIPYAFDNRFNDAGRKAVAAAIADYHKFTCIRFREKTDRDRNYLQFFHGGGCASYLGIQGGRQQVSLGYRCLKKGTAMHEMMHALGFYHEQSRIDRDNYVNVYPQNIRRGQEHNFQKYMPGQGETFGEPYDKKSIMHYGSRFFTANGGKTIESRANPDEFIGQREGFSEIDIRQLNKLYNCETKTTATTAAKEKKDVWPFCGSLEQRWCRSNLVKSNCQRRCDSKTPHQSEVCADSAKHGAHCAGWAESNYCTEGKYVGYMEKHCMKSCLLC